MKIIDIKYESRKTDRYEAHTITTTIDEDHIAFLTHGCDGEGNAEQAKVWEEISKVQDHYCGINSLGDAVYEEWAPGDMPACEKAFDHCSRSLLQKYNIQLPVYYDIGNHEVRLNTRPSLVSGSKKDAKAALIYRDMFCKTVRANEDTIQAGDSTVHAVKQTYAPYPYYRELKITKNGNVAVSVFHIDSNFFFREKAQQDWLVDELENVLFDQRLSTLAGCAHYIVIESHHAQRGPDERMDKNELATYDAKAYETWGTNIHELTRVAMRDVFRRVQERLDKQKVSIEEKIWFDQNQVSFHSAHGHYQAACVTDEGQVHIVSGGGGSTKGTNKLGHIDPDLCYQASVYGTTAVVYTPEKVQYRFIEYSKGIPGFVHFELEKRFRSIARPAYMIGTAALPLNIPKLSGFNISWMVFKKARVEELLRDFSQAILQENRDKIKQILLSFKESLNKINYTFGLDLQQACELLGNLKKPFNEVFPEVKQAIEITLNSLAPQKPKTAIQKEIEKQLSTLLFVIKLFQRYPAHEITSSLGNIPSGRLQIPFKQESSDLALEQKRQYLQHLLESVESSIKRARKKEKEAGAMHQAWLDEMTAASQQENALLSQCVDQARAVCQFVSAINQSETTRLEKDIQPIKWYAVTPISYTEQRTLEFHFNRVIPQAEQLLRQAQNHFELIEKAVEQCRHDQKTNPQGRLAEIIISLKHYITRAVSDYLSHDIKRPLWEKFALMQLLSCCGKNALVPIDVVVQLILGSDLREFKEYFKRYASECMRLLGWKVPDTNAVPTTARLSLFSAAREALYEAFFALEKTEADAFTQHTLKATLGVSQLSFKQAAVEACMQQTSTRSAEALNGSLDAMFYKLLSRLSQSKPVQPRQTREPVYTGL